MPAGRQGVPPEANEQLWPPLRELSSIDALPTSSYRYLLELDDDLATELDLRMRLVARQVPVQTCTMVPVAVPACLTCP